MSISREHNEGFTLLELLVVMGIIALIMALAVPNLMGARIRARDTRKKAEMSQLKNALRMFYNDNQRYPTINTGNPSNFNGCGSRVLTGDYGQCPCANGIAFGTGIACSENVYMKKWPTDMGGGASQIKYINPDPDDFCLYTTLENTADTDIEASWARCGISCGDDCDSDTEYCTCAD